jgi:2-polyprenyl-3-methyl-5-hydroxy-6-metoxy-1,4-benzoquinol methylase
MPLLLKNRKPELQELMDRPDSNLQKLENTYRQFWWINRFLSKWKRIFKKEILPVLKEHGSKGSLLDIGFGGGDIPFQLNNLATKSKTKLDITAIETDSRSLEYVQQLGVNDNIDFQNISSTQILESGMHYDFVISNHVLHHLNEDTLQKMCEEAEQLALKKVIFNDLERSDIAYILFFIISKILFRNSFISTDGLISIKRSYTFDELSEIAPKGWKVQRIFPFRLILSYEC